MSRGSLLGLGLLVATGSTAAPVALADDETTPPDLPTTQPDPGEVQVGGALELEETPGSERELGGDFGLGKPSPYVALVIGVEGVAPADLDRSGAVLTLTGESADADPLTCTTDADGVCVVYVDGPEEGGDEGTDEGTDEVLAAAEAAGGSVAVPPGSYAVQQTGGGTGLAPATGATWTIEICDPSVGSIEGFFCMIAGMVGATGVIPNDSLFTNEVVTTVVDADTLAPVAGASYRFTGGPDYPRLDGAPADDCVPDAPVDEEGGTGDEQEETGDEGDDLPPIGLPGGPGFPGIPGLPGFPLPLVEIVPLGAEQAADPVTEPAPEADDSPVAAASPASAEVALPTSDEQGVLTHLGCFLPGAWTLEAVTTPAGYVSADVPVLLADTFRDEDGVLVQWASVTARLQPVGSTPVPPVVVPPGTQTPQAPVPPAGTGGTGGTGGSPAPAGTGGSTPGGPAAGARPAGAPAAPSAPAAAPSAPAAAPSAPAAVPTPATRPATPSGTAKPAAPAGALADPAPALRTESSTNVLEAGLVGFGILFVALVFFLVLWMRRRAREQRG
ncbi:hypothetical protein [Blastococcus sp. URHD0036]|uniref:hypothetical protein n=1 Tax=Blastococcus sp. URHD0036 TaxID=1380356 RepID=UPI0005554E8E|nr:hypothetical protein [Blastococcus sp. URHD0036]